MPTHKPNSSALRHLPSVQSILSDSRIKRLIDTYSHESVVELVRLELNSARDLIIAGDSPPTASEIAISVEVRALDHWQPWPSHVINATGVILHTNLGRAPLSHSSLIAIENSVKGYSDLELDLDTGTRGSRQVYVSRLVCQLIGTDRALAVNNNASALLLGLASVATGKEVIVSRSEAIEIGGGFRIPDVLDQSGAHLVEVGTTNRTYVTDFSEAINERTGAILSAHTSNFKVTGFTHSPDLSDLVDLGRDHDIPVLHDLGSGCLLDTTKYGLSREPTPQESARTGVSLTFFSGDKLLGGPQSGIIAGQTHLVENASRHPMARAVRIDKLSLAALTTTLVHYIKEEAETTIPVWQMISASPETIETRAKKWADKLGDNCDIIAGLSTVGGGSLPGESLPTYLLRLNASAYPGGPAELTASLRQGNPPIITRIERDNVVLDPRTVLIDEEDELLTGIIQSMQNVP